MKLAIIFLIVFGSFLGSVLWDASHSSLTKSVNIALVSK